MVRKEFYLGKWRVKATFYKKKTYKKVIIMDFHGTFRILFDEINSVGNMV